MLKKFILAAMTLSLAACAFDQDRNAAKQREIEQNGKLQQTYKPVIGTYAGKITTSESIQDVEVMFFELKVEDGKNSDGSTRFISKLHATYKRINPVGSSYDFVVGIAPETGDLTMVNVIDLKSLGRDDIQTIDAKINGNNILGEVKAISGTKGILNLALKARESGSSDSAKDEFAYYERIRAQLNAISGVYEGTLEQSGNSPLKGTVGIAIRLYVQEVANGSTTIPQLIGDYNRADDPNGTVALNLTGIYDADLNPPRLTLTGKPRYNANTNYVATIYGTLVNGVLTGDMSTNVNGLTGKLTVKKKP